MLFDSLDFKTTLRYIRVRTAVRIGESQVPETNQSADAYVDPAEVSGTKVNGCHYSLFTILHCTALYFVIRPILDSDVYTPQMSS